MTEVAGGIAGWRPDPFGRHETRFNDGARWTPYVRDGENHSLDDPSGVSVPGGEDPAQARSIFTEDVLVVEQRVKIMELANDYDVFGADGERLATVRESNQGPAKKIVRALTSYDQYLTHTLEVLDARGEPSMTVVRPAKLMKSSIIVRGPGGLEVGRIIQRNVIGKIGFSLQAAGGGYVGTLQAENWVAWNFRVEDNVGRTVATVTKKWEGLVRNLFTTADSYVVRLKQPVAEPLRTLTVAAALAVDTALKQDARGLN